MTNMYLCYVGETQPSEAIKFEGWMYWRIDAST